MPRSRSIFIQSERVLRRSPLALTWPARLMAPPNNSNFSVSVVLPASGCEMIAKVRRRATSWASGERDGRFGCNGEVGHSGSVWQGNRAGSSKIGTIHIGITRLNSSRGVSDYRSSNTAQYASAATPAAAGIVITQA